MSNSLPSMDIFPSSAPRYPNVWFYMEQSLCSSYDGAVKLLLNELEDCTGMANDFGYFHNAEGCDAFAQRRGLQPIRLGPDIHAVTTIRCTFVFIWLRSETGRRR